PAIFSEVKSHFGHPCYAVPSGFTGKLKPGGRYLKNLNRQINQGNKNIKGGAFVYLCFCCDDAVMILHNFLNDCQPDSRAFVFCFSVQALKYFKYFFAVLLFKSDSII